MSIQILFELIKASLWNQVPPQSVDYQIYAELKDQAIGNLPSAILSSLSMPGELKVQWEEDTLQVISFYAKYCYAQKRMPISVPYVILKGTSASQYYPHPEYRTLGDIDIMTRREDFDTAFQELLDNGYENTKSLLREETFVKNGIVIELHRYFASLNDPEKAKYLDDLIIDNINPSHRLPDLVNGLVLLEHISQHLENGLGLRQIIDWMMFVDKCLPDDKWSSFGIMAQNIGLEKLAVIVTRMCEIYLGLSEHKWCAGTDDRICQQLMDYLLSCGNFGIKHVTDSNIVENVFARASTPKVLFKTLQARGLKNWKACQRYPVLKPFAWIYQGFRYINRGIFRKDAISKLTEEHEVAMRRNAMFKALGVKTAARGVVVYRDGEYVKT